MKKLIIALSFFMVGTMAYSQAELAIGLKGGPNFANATSSNDINSEGITSFHGGAYARIKILSLGIQPEVLWSSQGTTIGNDEIDFNYVNVPVMFMFNLPLGLNFHAGPQFGFLTSAELDNGTDIKNTLKDSDISLALGAGWSFRKINVTARYLIGTSDINDNLSTVLPFNSNEPELRNSVFQLSLGFDLISLGN